MKDKIVYSEYSETLRINPQNYLLANKHNGHWIIDPDLAIDKDIAIKAFKIISLIHQNRYHASGEYLASLLNEKL